MNSGSNSSSPMPERDPQKLEAFVHRALREQPTYRAPASLESRVFAAIAARSEAPAPWWQVGWQAWPLAPRVAVLTTSVLVLAAIAWVMLHGGEVAAQASTGSWVENNVPWLASLSALVETLVRAVSLLTRGVQPYILPLCLTIGLGYIALIGLGTSLFRSLIPARVTSEEFHD